MNQLVPVAIVGIILCTIYKIIELFVRRRERVMIIEKLCENSDNLALNGGLTLPEFGEKTRGGFVMLRIGSFFAGLGLGMLIAGLMNVFLSDCMVNYSHDYYLYPGVVILCTSLGSIAGFIVEYKLSSKSAGEQR